ncbi:YibE/F family protein [Nocardioides sp. LHG3406-4]|uniref:YibE/F family protein n=1 Tax=Nocardioides sp. LHG3406-4 TaxID=2804575 RepID=UPI003CEAB791
MGSGHQHGADLDDVRTRAAARAILLAFLAVVGVATVVGLLVMWPGDAGRPSQDFTAPGVTFEDAEVVDVLPACPVDLRDMENADECGQVRVSVLSGPDRGDPAMVQVPLEVQGSGLRGGDEITVLRTPNTGAAPSYAFFSVQRNLPLGVLAVVFVLVVAAVARLRGLLALLGLGFGAWLIVTFMLPALTAGSTGLGVALVGSSAILYVVLYLAHGVSVRTSAALASTLVAIGITAAISAVAIGATRLTGVSDDSGSALTSFAPDMDFQGLLTCAVIVAGLGVLNDVTITQTSAVWELRGAAPGLGRRQLFTRGMRIGRDHIASTIYTIVFAYAGAALSVLILLSFYDLPATVLLSREEYSEEIVRTLASAIGLVLAVPISTLLATLTVGPPAGHDGRPVRGRRRAGS